MPERVFVTGGSGYIASHTINNLLQNTDVLIRTSIRSEEKARFLKELPNATNRIEFVKADLQDVTVFSEALKDCDACFHIASPYFLNVSDPQRDLVDPAVNGTRNVLNACAAIPSIKKVILTSSVAAIADEPRRENEPALTENDWNTKSSLTRNPYYYSKVLAEKEAWELSKGKHFKLVVINPFLVMGPSLNEQINESVHNVIVDMTKWVYPCLLRLSLALVDVRDVAESHVKAYQRDNAEGRYICASETLDLSEIADAIKEATSGCRVWLPIKFVAPDWVIRIFAYTKPKGTRSFMLTNIGKGKMKFDNSKIQRDLGIKFISGRDIIKDTVADLIKWNHIKRNKPAKNQIEQKKRLRHLL